MSFTFKVPLCTVMGKDALINSESCVKQLGTKALIVTGKHVTKTGLTEKVKTLLESWGIKVAIFTGITGEPTDEMIRAGVAEYKSENCDFLIGLGGGSPLDSAKAIAVAATFSESLNFYMGKEIVGNFPTVVAIPTTAGTGSEATKFFIVTDTKTDVKMLLKGDCLIPTVAILDSSFTHSSPASVTAATGMDALTHAIESFTSVKANPMTDTFALSAIKRIFSYLPIAYVEPNDVTAREQLSIAAYEAGVCINNASVTLVHGMSRPIGALFHVPHGISNAMLLLPCLKFAEQGCVERFNEIASVVGCGPDPEAFFEKLQRLCSDIEIPRLGEYGIDKVAFITQLDKMATDALASGSPGNTRRVPSKEEIIDLYKQAW